MKKVQNPTTLPMGFCTLPSFRSRSGTKMAARRTPGTVSGLRYHLKNMDVLLCFVLQCHDTLGESAIEQNRIDYIYCDQTLKP